MKLSIVIPVYNGQQHLTQIIDCLKAQTCKNFEAIFINDGSTDNTEAEFKRLRPSWGNLNIQMYSQENQGVSVARNFGIQKVTGEILSFCDVDDIIPSHYVEFALKAFNSAEIDVVFWKFVRGRYCRPPQGRVQAFELDLVCWECFLEDYLYKRFVCCCGSYAVKTSIIRENDIYFEKGIRYGEDLNYAWKVLLSSKVIGKVDNPLYYYTVREDSVMGQFDERRLDGYRAAINLTEFVYLKAPMFAPLYEKYEAPRILWSIAWQAAVKLDSRLFHEFCSKCPMRETMQMLVDYPSTKVRVSSRMYGISPELFRCTMRVIGKIRCN